MGRIVENEKDRRRKELGKKGEDMAVSLLEGNGMKVLARNFRYGPKELDIIAAEPVTDSTVCPPNLSLGQQTSHRNVKYNLHFVEVKTRQEPIEGQPWESVGVTKQQHLVKAARGFLSSDTLAKARISYDEIFFDIVSIVWNREGTDYTMEYIPDAFRPMFY